MRARHRYLLLAVVSALAVVLVAPSTPARADEVVCPASTSWDNVLHRCV